MKNQSQTEMLMQMQDQIATVVATLTGMKSQLVAAGWTPEAAEQVTIEAFRQGGGK